MKYGGLIALMIVVVAGGAWLVLDLGSKRDEIASLRAETEQLQAQVERLQLQKTEIVKMDRQLKSLTEELAGAQAQPEPGQPSASSSPARTAPADPDAGETSHDAAGQASPIAGIMQMYEGEGGEKMRKATARMTVDMQYGSLLGALALPADVDEQVRGIFAASAENQLTTGMKIMGGATASGKELKRQEQDAVAELRAQLSQVLTPEELAQWEEYEADKERHMMEQSFEMQIAMFAPGMAEETRQIVRDVLVDEIVAGSEEFAESEQPVGIAGHAHRQLAAFQRAREELEATLTEEEYRQAENFIAQQEQMLEASMEMMRGLVGNNTEAPAAVTP